MRNFPSIAVLAALLACPVAGAYAQTPDLPDLTIQSHSVSGGKVTAVVANTGRAGAGLRTTATLFVYQDGKTHSTADQSIPALAPGATVTLAFPLPVATGVYQVMADSKRELAEASETNNRTLNASFGGQASGPRNIGGGIKVTGPITGPAPGTLKIVFKPDARLQSLVSAQPRLTATDGSLRPVGAARSPEGLEMLFIENELLLTGGTPQQAADFAARWNGKVVSTVNLGAGIGNLYQIRVDTSKPADVALTAQELKTPFSSEAAYNLLTIAKSAKKAGLRMGINLLTTDDGVMEGVTTEGKGKNALKLDYMQKGGTFNVDVENAWKMLSISNGFGQAKIPLGILDGGFGYGRSDFMEKDVDVSITMESTGKNRGNCGEKNPCPWHGSAVAEAAAGLYNDGRGSAGPGAPSALLLLFDKAGKDLCTSLTRLKQLRDNGARIMNMSFSGEAPRGTGWFDDTWSDAVETFENVTRDMYNKEGRLLFASAGNDSKNIDAKNNDGDETVWHWPCENDGVICVGGWYEKFMPNPNQWGTDSAIGSNFSSSYSGATIDIFGPWCTEVGDNPDSQGKDVVTTSCGTSVSSPFVAGVASLVWWANPNLSNQQVWGLMNKHAIPAGSIRRVHASGAVREALVMRGLSDAPYVKITAKMKSMAGFSQGETLLLTHDDFDIEDVDACCAAKWYVDDVEVFSIAANSQPPQLKMAGLKTGQHELKVTITTKAGRKASQETSFTVSNAAPKVVVKAMTTEMFTGLPYEFRAEVTDDAFMLSLGGEACKTVTWSASPADTTPAVLTGCSITPKFSTSGPHTLTASYTDALGAKGMGQVNFTVKPGVKVGVVITKPMAGNSFDSLQPINYVAEVSHGQGGKTNVSWTLTDTKTNVTRPLPLKIGNDKTFTFEKIFPEYSGSTAGRDYVLTATALNPNGDKASHSIPLHQRAFIH
jgi:serine protease